MSDSRQNQAPGSVDLWSVILFTLLILAALAVLAGGIYLAVQEQQYEVLAIGALSVIAAASGAAVVHSRKGGGGRDTEVLQAILNRLSMSEVERRMVDRQRDLDKLRKAILSDIGKEDFGAALALVDEMADRFGYREEAEQYRQQIIDARSRRMEQMVHESITRIQNLCRAYDWTGAHREAARLMRLVPDAPRLQGLPAEIDQARDAHKHELERNFLQAAEAGDTDRAMNLLKELDLYLTEEEGANYKEVARGVVGQARHNMGVRFKLAVSDKDWVEALGVGETIIREFPNTKMANEVRGMIDLLRERARGQQAAEAGRTV